MAELKETCVKLVAKDSAKFQSDIAKSKKALSGFGDTGTKVALAFTGFNAAMQIVGQAFRTAKGIFDETVGSLIAYNKSILDASRATGTTAEDFSRIVQIADDFGISMGSVETALALATKNGFAPSVDSIADLADRLNAIQDPTERAAQAAKIFGRNWAALDPLLQEGGDAIRANAAAVRDGLVVTEEEIQKTETLRLQLDTLNDSWTVLKNTVGLEAVPALSQGAMFLNFLAEAALDLAEGKGLTDAADRLEALRISLLDLEAPTGSWEDQMRSLGGTVKTAGGDISEGLDEAKRSLGDLQAASDNYYKSQVASIEGLKLLQAGSIQGPQPGEIVGRVPLEGAPASFTAARDALTPVTEEAGKLRQEFDNTVIAAAAVPVAAGDKPLWGTARKVVPQHGGDIDDIIGRLKKAIELARKLQGMTIGAPLVSLTGQHGLDVMVPPGYTNDRFTFGASSGERVIIQTPAQQMVPQIGSPGITNNANQSYQTKTIIFQPTITRDVDGIAMLESMRQEVQRQ